MPTVLKPSPIYDPIISVKTKKAKSRFTLYNPSRKAVTVFDPEQVFKQGERCDFVFEIPSHPLELYVELKGSDLDKAMNQLASTMQLVSSPLQPKKCVIVIWQGAPPNANTQRQNQKLAFARKHKCQLEWHTQHGSYRL